MTRAPARKTATAFAGTWHISETELWDHDALDTVQPAFIRFDDEMIGSIGMMVIQAGLDCRFGERDGKPLVEFTFDGDDDGHPCCGRGWATLDAEGILRGRFFIHLGDDSEFVAGRATPKAKPSPSSRARRTPRR